jgi:hypothetical protein
VRRVELRLRGRVLAPEVDGRRRRVPLRLHGGDQSLVPDVGVRCVWMGKQGTTGGRRDGESLVAAMLPVATGQGKGCLGAFGCGTGKSLCSLREKVHGKIRFFSPRRCLDCSQILSFYALFLSHRI